MLACSVTLCHGREGHMAETIQVDSQVFIYGQGACAYALKFWTLAL